MWTLDKTTFENESAFQMTLYLARTMLEDKLITEKEYRDFKKEIIKRYEPFFGDLYT
ncbi:SHOCT domain-containing protein [Phascolarctobacterium faecium]|uniref:SHOCT domain-containing protein n=1 Tax=Phascolarctobacterium faecium TaxID=33025 RepID=UPI00351FB5D8